LGDRYYISMADTAGAYHLFVYDSALGLWHREDGLHASHLAALEGKLYAIDASSRNILCLTGEGEPEAPVRWMAQTGSLGLSFPQSKYISRLVARLALKPGSRMEIEVCYDRENRWERLGVVFGTELRSILLPMRLRRCDQLQLRFSGTGPARLYSLTMILEKGSDRP